MLGSQSCYLSWWHHTQMLLERRCICRHVLLGVWGCCVGVPELLASCICCWRGAFTRCSVGMTGMLLYWGHGDVLSAVGVTHRCCWRGGAFTRCSVGMTRMLCWGHRDVSCWHQADAVVSFVSSVHWITGMLHQLQLF